MNPYNHEDKGDATLAAIQLVKTKLSIFGHVMMPNYKTSPHILKLCNALERVAKGELKRLMVFMPPRHAKSTHTSFLFPSFFLGNYPEKQIIFSTYSQEFANDFGRKVRNLISSETFKMFFDKCELAEDSQAVNRFNTKAGGSYFAVGAGGPITGRGGDILLLDDIIKNRVEANSPTFKRRLEDWWSSTMYTRLMPNGAIIFVCTRWAKDDLAGSILANSDEEWEVISMPAINENNEALWPEQFNLEKLLRIKKNISAKDWNSLYQQRPTIDEGAIIKRAQIKEYDKLPTRFDEVLMSWDLAFKGNKTSDYSVGVVLGKLGANIYLLDCFRQKVDFPKMIEAFKWYTKKWPSASVKLVEDAANGAALISTLRSEIQGIVPVKPEGDKVSRVHSISHLFEAGNVLFPTKNSYSWVDECTEELVTFPDAPNDDFVDALTQGLRRLSSKTNSFFISDITHKNL